MIPDDEQILAYANEIQKAYPAMSKEDLREALSAQFIGGQDVLRHAAIGCVAPSHFAHCFSLLSITFNSLRKVITQDKKNLLSIQDKIDRTVASMTLTQ